ncbi:MAG: InlB B-repeat-containing protein, partial [Firmicutes bacterium]|nr:InlB B-repeat-containing protein [Bacillota bacterium]
VSIKTLGDKTYYAQFEKITVDYTVSFKYTDDSEALTTVTKALADSEDYVLSATDVKDVEHNVAPSDYEFLGWTEAKDGTGTVYTSAELQVSIKTLDGKTFYAQFKKVTDNYNVAFKYTDLTEALATVTKTLAPSEDYILTAADVKDVEFHTNPGDYEFLGWTDTIGGTDYKTSAELQTSIKSLDGKTFYAQFKKVTEKYTAIFKHADETEIVKIEKELAASEDYVLSAADLEDPAHPTLPTDYKFVGWTEAKDGTGTVYTTAELYVSIKTLGDKTYYAQFEKVTEKYTAIFKHADETEIVKIEKEGSSSSGVRKLIPRIILIPSLCMRGMAASSSSLLLAKSSSLRGCFCQLATPLPKQLMEIPASSSIAQTLSNSASLKVARFLPSIFLASINFQPSSFVALICAVREAPASSANPVRNMIDLRD